MADKISKIEARLLVDRFLALGWTKRKFAHENGLPSSTLSYYLTKYAPHTIKPTLTDEERANLVDEFLASNLTQEAFAEQRKIASVTLSTWLAKFDPDQERLTERQRRRKLVLGNYERKEKLLDEYLESDLTQREFAELKGLVLSTMKKWFAECDPEAERRKVKNEKMNHGTGRSKAEKIALAREYLGSGLSVIQFAESKDLKPIYVYKCLYLRNSETLYRNS